MLKCYKIALNQSAESYAGTCNIHPEKNQIGTYNCRVYNIFQVSFERLAFVCVCLPHPRHYRDVYMMVKSGNKITMIHTSHFPKNANNHYHNVYNLDPTYFVKRTLFLTRKPNHDVYKSPFPKTLRGCYMDA